MFSVLFLIAAFIFGTLIGSFLNVVIWRLPRQQSLGGRSHCPHCGYVLKPRNLIPVISYLAQSRRCTNCKGLISPRYAMIEIVTGLLFAAAAAHLPAATFSGSVAVALLRLFVVIAVLVAVFVIDLEHYLILDRVVFPAAAITLVLNITLDLVNQQSLFHLSSFTGGGLVAAVLASGFFYLIWRFSKGLWMGFGDVKFNLFLGLALGWPGIVVALFLAFMLGAIAGVGLIVLRLKQLHSRVPFGTFLSLGALLALFYGPALANWYARLIGWQ